MAVLGKHDTYLLYQQAGGELGAPTRPMNTGENLGLAQIVDLDGDGRNDLCYLSSSDPDRPFGVRLQTPEGRLGPELRCEFPKFRGVTYADLDGKPGSEVLAIEAQTGRVKIHQLQQAEAQPGELAGQLIQYGFGQQGAGKNRDLATGDDVRVVLIDPSVSTTFEIPLDRSVVAAPPACLPRLQPDGRLHGAIVRFHEAGVAGDLPDSTALHTRASLPITYAAHRRHAGFEPVFFPQILQFGGETAFLSLQNGWGNADRLAAVNERAEEILRHIGLSAVRHVRGAELSHGEQRYLEIGIALATDPEFLLLDEPTAGMSPDETQRTAAFVRKLAGHVTIVVVEHDMDVVMGISDRITVLNYGEVLAEGTPAEIRENADVRRVYLRD
jgi:ABC-type lipopolysaccharide export system ATPase subunit